MSEPATVEPEPDRQPDDDGLLTIDELSAAVGITVRTLRYYATLGLVPPPVKRGRTAYYGPAHVARLELVRALQEHGFTLQAIEKVLARVPAEASVADVDLQRAMLTSWTGAPPETVTRRQLEQRAGRSISDDDLRVLVGFGAVDRLDGGRLQVHPHLRVTLELLDLGLPEASMASAHEAISHHMEALVADLTDVLRTEVIGPARGLGHGAEATARLEQMMPRLRQLTLEAVVSGFERAADDVITRALSRDHPSP